MQSRVHRKHTFDGSVSRVRRFLQDVAHGQTETSFVGVGDLKPI
jgi:hypothetical protein